MWFKVCSVILIIFNVQAFEEFDLYDVQDKPNTGESCEWEGKNGTCTNFWHCITNAIDAVHGKHPPVCRQENGEVLACCTGCKVITTNISSIIIVNQLGLMLKRTGQKAADKCMEYMNLGWFPCFNKPGFAPGKVAKDYSDDKQCYNFYIARWLAAGGEDAVREEFPHMALLGYGEDVSSAEWLCGGSIISEKYILTAAHCQSSSQSGEVKYVGLGILKRSDPKELWQIHEVARFIPHPKYHSPSSYNDIALVQTNTHIKFGQTVLPACLPIGEDNTEKGLATGWGALGHRQKNADVLQKVELSRFGKEQCSTQYKPHKRRLASGYNHTMQMCYGDTQVGRDTCEGDSGGPLLAENSCPPIVMGVTSSGHPCGFQGGAGLYTRVQHYVPWIESIVWP